ncbi:uncharacterized protein [Excalfactoria chinensis]|uniref:uncharacterized protein isoform X2 n=1 Tax=Excalfactoria chinensis TaxID=46218 RepID=UPI003B3A0F4A
MGYGNPKRGHSLVLNDLQGLFQHKPRSVPVTSQDPPVLVTSQCRADLTEPPRGGAGAVGQRRTCRPHSAGGAGPASSCASGAAMRAQFASGTLTALQRVELLQQLEQVSSGWTGTEGPSCRLEGTLPTAWQQRAGCQRRSFPLPQAYERMMENRTAAARASLLKDAQQIRAERTAARKEELEQEKQLIGQLEEQLKAGSEEMEVLRREKQRLREEREELELEGAWQQHQMELEVERVPGAVLPELVEAQLVRGRTHSTLTPSNRGLPGDRAPCSTVVLLGSRVLHEALLRSGP